MEEDSLPLALDNCPIISSVVEIRFTSEYPPQAVFGIAYDRLKDKYPKVEKLPILQLPQAIVESDPNLKNRPHFRLEGEVFIIQIGPDVVNVSPEMPYPGWSVFYPKIEELFGQLVAIGVVSKIFRLGIRYTNFFPDTDIFKKLNLKIQYNQESIPYQKTILRTELPSGGFNNTLQVSNDSVREEPGKGIEYGSIVDIDTYKEYGNSHNDLATILKDVNNGHNIEKKIFWDLLNEDLKKELKPSY